MPRLLLLRLLLLRLQCVSISLKSCAFAALSLLAVGAAAAHAADDSRVLFDFEQNFDVAAATTTINAEARTETNAGNTRLVVSTRPSPQNPGVVLHGPTGGWDLSGYHQVKMRITNAGQHLAKVVFKVGDPADSMQAWQMEYRFDLPPGETRTVIDEITTTPWLFSEPLEILGLRAAPGHAKADLTAIDQVKVTVEQASEPHTLVLDDIRATAPVRYVSPEGFLPFVDKFGQYKHAHWPGKTLSEDDLRQHYEEESQRLRATPGPGAFNKYGGWQDGPRFDATGYFRPQKHAGVWWLVDPEGCLFWSHGACCVGPGAAITGVTDREAYFENLPTKESSFGEFYGKAYGAAHGHYRGRGERDTYNFTAANLYRKYGPGWRAANQAMTHARLRSWGMNTLGVASDRALCNDRKTPYVDTVWVKDTKKIEASSGYWGKFHDVFDPSFLQQLRKALVGREDSADDPWCLGYFIENELSWGQNGSLALATLASPADQIAKQVFIDDLKQKYQTIDALNTTWGTSHASWQALLDTQETPDKQRAKSDLLAFYEKIAVTYFSTVRREMKAVAPNTLYLGCRIAWANSASLNSDVVVRTAAEYCDVLSFNKYEFSVEGVALPTGVDKPIVIGEFHFGALDRGGLHVGIREAFAQGERAELYQQYVAGALRNPYIIGTHWFQYGDQPPTGRGDGENYNVGLVDVCDSPFPELIRGVRSTGYRLYETRLRAAESRGAAP